MTTVQCAFELRDQTPAGKGPGQPDRGVGGLGTRMLERELVAVRHDVAQQTRQIQLHRRQVPVARSAMQPVPYEFDDRSGRVPVQSLSAEAHVAVQVSVAIHVGDAAAERFAYRELERGGKERPERLAAGVD